MRVEQERQLIDEAIQESRAPRRVASGRTVIAASLGRNNKSYLVLANGAELTRAGEYYYSQTNALRPAKHFDRSAQTVRRGDGDYIQTSSGLRRVRQIMPDGTMSLTALGRKYYKDKHIEAVVEIPVRIQVFDSKNRRRTRTDVHLPVDALGVGRILVSQGLTPDQRVTKIKSDVLAQIGGRRTAQGRTVLQEISGQVFSYDPDGDWLISTLETSVDAQGHAHTEAQMHQDLNERFGLAPGAAPPRIIPFRDLSRGEPMRGFSSAAFLPHPPECYLDEAFQEHDDCLCVPRQLAALLNRPLGTICESFDEILDEGWRDQGARPEELEKWCALHGHPYFLVRTGKLVKIVDPPEKLGKAVAYCLFDNHCFMYKTARTVSSWGGIPQIPPNGVGSPQLPTGGGIPQIPPNEVKGMQPRLRNGNTGMVSPNLGTSLQGTSTSPGGSYWSRAGRPRCLCRMGPKSSPSVTCAQRPRTNARGCV